MRLQDLLAARYGAESVEYHLALVEGAAAQLSSSCTCRREGAPEVPSRRARAGGRAASRAPGTTASPTSCVARYGDAEGRRLARCYCRAPPRLLQDRHLARARARRHRRCSKRVRRGRAVRRRAAERAARAHAGGRAAAHARDARDARRQGPAGRAPARARGARADVMEEVPTRLDGGDDGAYLHDFGVLVRRRAVDCERDGELLAEAHHGRLERALPSPTALGALVVRAGMRVARRGDPPRLPPLPARSSRRRSPRRTRTTCSSRIRRRARLLVELFRARFCDDAGEAPRPSCAPVLAEQLAAVGSLDEDRILRGFLGADRRHGAHQRGTRGAATLLQAALGTTCRGMPRPAPALRDLRLPPAGRGHPPARRARGARRHPLVGPARGLPHRGARADEGADGQERRDRARSGAKGGFVLRTPPIDRDALREEVRRATRR